jgi:glycerophosphoryl diester phosphodiesterase
LAKRISIQGHRGARGHFPENTINGFIAAIEMGVDTIELDVVISADNKVVVSHEAWMNDQICSLPGGDPIPEGKGKEFNLFAMPYDEIKKFDCGKRGHPAFPGQRRTPAYKPLLDEVLKTVEAYINEKNLRPVVYNIELKSEEGEELFNPEPRIFVDLVYREIYKYQLGERLIIQSFDTRLLREMRKKDGSIRLGFLIENHDALEINLALLPFIPYAYNPEFVLVNEQLVNEVHKKGMKIFAWTVNEKNDIMNTISMGVDGIISDYPDRVIDLVKK